MSDEQLALLLAQELSGFFAEAFGRGRYRLLYRCDRTCLKPRAVRRGPLPLDGKPLFNRKQLLVRARGLRHPRPRQPSAAAPLIRRSLARGQMRAISCAATHAMAQ